MAIDEYNFSTKIYRSGRTSRGSFTLRTDVNIVACVCVRFGYDWNPMMTITCVAAARRDGIVIDSFNSVDGRAGAPIIMWAKQIVWNKTHCNLWAYVYVFECMEFIL